MVTMTILFAKMKSVPKMSAQGGSRATDFNLNLTAPIPLEIFGFYSGKLLQNSDKAECG